MIDSILTGGRTARLYKALVEPQIALDIGSANGFPGDKLGTVMLLYGLTAPGHTVDEIAVGFDGELARLKAEPVDEATLDRVKTQARAGLLGQLDSTSGMASLLTEYEAKTGDWRNVFEELKLIEAVSAADVQRVAQATFNSTNRTVGRLISVNEETLIEAPLPGTTLPDEGEPGRSPEGPTQPPTQSPSERSLSSPSSKTSPVSPASPSESPSTERSLEQGAAEQPASETETEAAPVRGLF